MTGAARPIRLDANVPGTGDSKILRGHMHLPSKRTGHSNNRYQLHLTAKRAFRVNDKKMLLKLLSLLLRNWDPCITDAARSTHILLQRRDRRAENGCNEHEPNIILRWLLLYGYTMVPNRKIIGKSAA